MQRPTQTHDDPIADAGSSQVAGSARLIRFFRADAPALDVDEFCLGERPSWTLSRLDPGQPFTAGPENARIVCRDDVLMSARHAVLTRRGDQWEVEDTRSKNGTFVNAERVTGPVVLQDGDILECGNSFFIFREPDSCGASGEGSQEPVRDVTLSMPPLHYQIAPIMPFAQSALAIHLHGETGTGKDIVARAVHELSSRRGPFVARNCAAIPDSLFESELFGHTKGAFSGATTSKRGQVIEAHHGTLFLDEIGELSLSMQAKLLRVLELKEVLPIGANASVPVDFRLISATLSDLRAMVAQGKFRRDLYGRLGREFLIPPLREHKEYIGALVPQLLAATPLPEQFTIASVRFTTAAARALVYYAWPFNIRELKLFVQSALTAAWACRGPHDLLRIDTGHLPRALVDEGEQPMTANATRQPQRARATVSRHPKTVLSDGELLTALHHSGGNRAEAARVLGVSERTVFRRIRRLRFEQSAS